MIQPFPLFSFSRQRPNTYYTNYAKTNNLKSEKNPYFPSNTQNVFKENFSVLNKNVENQKKCNDTNNTNSSSYKSEEIFNILGLNLHFDDLLIICLLLFLYNEDVKDNYLYFALILLLLS